MGNAKRTPGEPPFTRRIRLQVLAMLVFFATIHIAVGVLTSSFWAGLLAVGVVALAVGAGSTVYEVVCGVRHAPRGGRRR